MENEHVLSGLLRKRAEIGGQLVEARAVVSRLAVDLDSVDATIRLFDPQADLAQLPVKPVPHRHAAYHGEISRPILSALRSAAEPITTHDMTLRVLAARGLSTADKAFVRSMQKRVGAALRHMRRRGAVEADQRNGGNLWWKLAP